MYYTPQTSPWILGSRQNTCQQYRRILETKFVRNQTSNRFNEPYLLVRVFTTGTNPDLAMDASQCYSCSPKWWWFLYALLPPSRIAKPRIAVDFAIVSAVPP